MTRRILPTLLAIVIALLLTACVEELPPVSEQGTTTTTTTAADADPAPANEPSGEAIADARITKDEAKAIALRHAGLSGAAIRNLEIELDLERGVWEYEVEFDYDGFEYSYDIHAETGEILYSKKELDR